MSVTLSPANVAGYSPKRELAERLTSGNDFPREVLQSIFQGSMTALEEISDQKLDPTLRNTIWGRVSKERLETLREQFLQLFCHDILGIFELKEAEEMLVEHKRFGSIAYSNKSIRLQVAFQLNQEKIKQKVMEQALSIKDQWVEEIIKAAKEEGVNLPERG